MTQPSQLGPLSGPPRTRLRTILSSIGRLTRNSAAKAYTYPSYPSNGSDDTTAKPEHIEREAADIIFASIPPPRPTRQDTAWPAKAARRSWGPRTRRSTEAMGQQEDGPLALYPTQQQHDSVSAVVVDNDMLGSAPLHAAHPPSLYESTTGVSRSGAMSDGMFEASSPPRSDESFATRVKDIFVHRIWVAICHFSRQTFPEQELEERYQREVCLETVSRATLLTL